jgi:hypothetical protein
MFGASSTAMGGACTVIVTMAVSLPTELVIRYSNVSIPEKAALTVAS